ncbi:MAG: SDR family NAD(P)-dependent oxidoreductase [Bacteroidota bacterium]
MYSLSGKTVLITGASSGIGEACARAFAAIGANLILGARRIDRLQELAAKIHEQYQVKILPVAMDVTDYSALEKTIQSLSPEWDEIEVLVNNAGLSLRLDKMQEARISDWETMIDTNVKGVLYLTRLVLPGMIRRNRGHIINLGSIASLTVYPGGNVYCATKSAVKALSEATRMDVNGYDIRVTLVQPGMTKTEFAMVRWSGDREKADQMYEGVEYLTPDDIAEVITFCATRPLHVDIGEVVITPTQQASIFVTHRKK